MKLTPNIRKRIELLARHGFSRAFIAKEVELHEGVRISLRTVTNALRVSGIQAQDYRDGLTKEAYSVAKRCYESAGMAMYRQPYLFDMQGVSDAEKRGSVVSPVRGQESPVEGGGQSAAGEQGV